MDILDLDEVLKDDSFCLLEADSGQDDINTILQQWRQNGCTSADNKVDTRTFTRPKRRSVQNLDSTFAMASRPPEGAHTNVHLRIGGLVTSGHMQKSYLQDTSPPSSILSSMDTSVDQMGNSLITSNDFTNVSFFNTNDFEDVLAGTQIANYCFDDVIKDRKTLESLSLSGESAIIKDCNIAQIDEMTFLSKTHSGYSTMQNSTESVPSGATDTFMMLNQTTVMNSNEDMSPGDVQSTNAANRTFVDSEKSTHNVHDDLISNTTMTLIDSSHIIKTKNTENGKDTFFKNTPENPNETFSKAEAVNRTFPSLNNSHQDIMNRTYHKEQDGNDTFNLVESPVLNQIIESPIIIEKSSYGRESNIQSSTPLRSSYQTYRKSMVNQTQHFQSILEDDVNISPRVPTRKKLILNDEFQLIDETKPYSDNSIDQLERYLGSLTINCTGPEEQIENFQAESEQQNNACNDDEYLDNGIDMLTDEKNEEKFDDMLEKISKSASLGESIKMRQSIDNIKKKHALLMHEKANELNAKSSESSVEMGRLLSDSLCKSSLSSSSSSERLLSRRSRLYDDVHVTKSSFESENRTIGLDDSKKANAKTDSSNASNSSYVVESKTETPLPVNMNENAVEVVENAKNLKTKNDRVRDPERFKTIRIFKRPTDNDIVPPCIDGEIEKICTDEEHEHNMDSKNDTQAVENSLNSTTVFNNNKSEIDTNIMYQTYKKPKNLIRPSITSETTNPVHGAPIKEIQKPRSLSRPKYISGIARRDSEFNNGALPKANSASDIHKTYNPSSNAAYGAGIGMRKLSNNSGTFLKKDTSSHELKSPMGTKAKSFTNLTGGAGGSGGVGFGYSSANRLSLLKPNSQPSLQNVKTIGMENNKEKNDRSNVPFRPTSNNMHSKDVERDEKFKVPPPVSNLRMPNCRRTGLARPSSGFYGQASTKNDPDIQTGRYSSNNSLSSTSSKGSAQENQQPTKYTNGYLPENSTINNETHPSSVNVQVEQAVKPPSNAVKTGIPKPSGLRQPTTVRRSGLPRPSSIVRR